MRPRWTHIKQIKTNDETQFPVNPMLNDEIEKKTIKKNLKK